MTQQQHIKLLQDIAPDIARTGDPEGVMLQAAHEHNLSPAQFRKLGHVYNTAKSLLVFEKAANRGDSFSLVDVPAMVDKYTTFDPTKKAGYKGEDAYTQFSSILDEADKDVSQEWNYWAGCMNGNSRQPDNTDLNDIVRNMWRDGVEFENTAHGRSNIELTIDGYVNQPDIVHEKAASAEIDYETQNALDKIASMDDFERHEYAKRMQKKAEQDCEHAMNCIQDYSRGIADAFVHEIRNEKADWKTIAHDIHDGLGTEKAAQVIDMLQDYFKDEHLSVPQVNIEDRGYSRAFAKDTYGLVDKAAELLECNDAYKKAASVLEEIKASGVLKKEAKDSKGMLSDVKGSDAFQFIPWLASKVGPMTAKDIDHVRRDAKENVNQVGALQQLILTDPVIQQADPAQVEDIYATISSLSPTVSKDPMMLGPVMKEALQYGSIPIQQVKDLLEVENTQKRINKAEKEINSFSFDDDER